MKKWKLFLVAIFLGITLTGIKAQASFSFASEGTDSEIKNLARAHHVSWPYSVITYNYKNEKGRWDIHVTTFAQLPKELQNKDWVCWVDNDGFDNCKTVN
jgi:hypothetical protein